MLRLYTLRELEREVTPEEFQHILTPEAALKKACSGQLKLATDLAFFQYRFSDSFGGNPPS